MAPSKFMSTSDKKKLCIAVISLTTALSAKRKKSERKIWTREWLKKRNKLGCYENLMRELALQDAEGYRRWIRMDTASFEYLLEKVSPLIQKRNTRMRDSIPPGERLALTLRYLSTGETQQSLSFHFRIAQNTISGILPLVCQGIFTVLKEEYLNCPSNENEWKALAADFNRMWNFPMCIGAMDGKHIKIMPPPGSGSAFYNYKGFFSIVLLALVDAHLKFFYVDIGRNGRISDGGVWAKSQFKQALDAQALNIPVPSFLPGTDVEVPFLIVADDAFPLGPSLMNPYPGKNLERNKRIFNYRLSRARRLSENAFGILAARFRIFHTQITSSVPNARLFVLETCALHNFLRINNSNSYLPAGSIDVEDITTSDIAAGDWRATHNNFINLRKTPQKSSAVARLIQDRFCKYFTSVGSVPWQEQMCNLH